MLKKTQQNERATAQERATMDSSHKENVNPSLVKGKGKAPAPKSGSAPNVHQKNPAHVVSTHGPAPQKEIASTSTGGVTPAGGPSPAAFNAEAIAILREMHSNQNKTNEKVETLALKVDELYNFDYDNEYDNFEEQQDLDLYEDPHDTADETSTHGSSIHIDIAESEGTSKRPMTSEDADDPVFGRYLKKFKKSDPVEKEVNPGLAKLVNNAFREGMADDTYNELIKLIHRPSNCETLKETSVNQGVWSGVSLITPGHPRTLYYT